MSTLTAGPWTDLREPAERLRLGPTLMSGMSFRWTRVVTDAPNPGTVAYFGVLGHTVYELRESPDTCWFRTHAPAAGGADVGRAERAIRRHLSLDRGVEATAWASDPRVPPHFAASAAALPGIRVLSIPSHLEALVSFVGSANNNIKRCSQMIAALCAAFPANCLGVTRLDGASRIGDRIADTLRDTLGG